MTELSLKLSAYLDGELSPTEALEIETQLDRDPAIQAQFDDLLQAQAVAQEQFAAQLDHPVDLALVRQIREASPPAAPAVRRPIWAILAASLVAVTIGGLGGYQINDRLSVQPPQGWLADIADYHGVYANQERHLVEVGADESEHIETWLGTTIGAAFSIPDLTAQGLTFEGGRLLVANGKPVAQLMYRQEDGTVIALCLQRSATSHEGPPVFKQATINGFDFVSWNAQGTNYVVIGPDGQPNLEAVAAQAATEI